MLLLLCLDVDPLSDIDSSGLSLLLVFGLIECIKPRRFNDVLLRCGMGTSTRITLTTSCLIIVSLRRNDANVFSHKLYALSGSFSVCWLECDKFPCSSRAAAFSAWISTFSASSLCNAAQRTIAPPPIGQEESKFRIQELC